MIRLVTVVGHGTNLLPHFIKHYSQYVDEIHIVAYITDNTPNLKTEILNVIHGYENVVMCDVVRDRSFDWNKVTQIYNYTKSKYPNDWWVVADIDELQLYPNNDLKLLISECEENGWDLVRGGFIDRVGIDGEFPEIQEDISLFEQFPNAGFFRYPLSNACPNKVCIMKGHVEITSGQHYAKIDGQTTWKWQGWNHPLIAPYSTHSIQVHHFKWDKTCVDRIKSVAEINEEYAYSNEYAIMYKNLRRQQFKIDTNNTDFMFESTKGFADFNEYKNWNKLINKIVSI